MKKTITILAIFIQFCVFASSAWAYDGSVVVPSGQTIYYNFISSSQTIEITSPNTDVNNPWGGYTNPSGDLVIPDSITHNGNNYPVTSIGANAFLGSIDLTSVTISNNVTSIGDRAFWNCRGMTSVSIGSGVTTIGFEAFQLCQGLTSVDIPDAVTSMGTYAFSDCYGLTSIHFGSGLTSLPSYAFWNCLSLPFVYIPDVITTVGSYAFYGCSSMASVEIGSGVTYIGYGAFACGMQEVRIHTPIPPSLGYPAFVIPTGGANLYVPCGADSAYQNAAQWNRFNIFEELPYRFSATSIDTTYGSVQVTQAPTCSDSLAVVLAVANTGYHFTHWSNGSTDNPLTLNVDSDTFLTAYFVQDTPLDTVWRTVTVTANVAGACETYGSGIYADSSIVEIGYIVPDTTTEGGHWQFLGWNDGVTVNPRDILVTSDTAIVALFEWVADSVGIAEIENGEPGIVIYPNPTSGRVTIANTDNIVAATLTDIMGRREEVHLTPTGPGQYTLDLTHHPVWANNDSPLLLTLTTADGHQHTVKLQKQ